MNKQEYRDLMHNAQAMFLPTRGHVVKLGTGKIVSTEQYSKLKGLWIKFLFNDEVDYAI